MEEKIELNYVFYEKTSKEDERYILNYLKKQKVISLDIETTRKYNKYPLEGLDPYTSNIVMFQIGTEDLQFVLDYRKVDISFLHEVLIDPNIQIVGQNLKFEYKHILHNEGIRINNLYDTMVCEGVLYNGFYLPLSLKDIVKRYLGIELEKDTRLEFLSIKDKPFTETQIKYGAKDILYPLKVRDLQLKDAKRKQLLATFDLEMKFLEVLGDIEYKGLNIDVDRWTVLYRRNYKEYQKLLKELDEFVLNNYYDTEFIDKQYDLFTEGFKCSIQWTSSDQVIKFFSYLDICPKEVSKSTNKLSYTVEAKVIKSSLNTTNKNIPDKLKDLLKLYLKFKKSEQTITTFGEKFLENVNPITGRLHSNYKQILNTGRISSSGPNLQNIPANPEYRQCFRADKGFKIINSDYSG